MANPQHWSGGLVLVPGRLTFSGHLGSAPDHRHAAVQIVSVEQGSVDVNVDNSRIPVVDAMAIPTGVRHCIVADQGAWGTITYLDPDRLQSRLVALESDPAVIERLLHGAAASPSELHPALRDAVDRARQLLRGPLLLTDLAAEVGISPSRLGHLFSDELGLSFPNWRRWARLQHALSEVTNGATLTTAAHAAGFADSAHLTRTCREMFGITPTQAMAATQPGATQPEGPI